MRILSAFIAVFTTFGMATAQNSDDAEVYACRDVEAQVFADGQCLVAESFKSSDLSERPVLVVALHGDAPFTQPSYQYAFADLVSQRSRNTIAVGLLRPGYVDRQGRQSDGVRGLTVGDNYDADRVSVIASAVRELKSQYNADKVILAGHSGGAAIAGRLIALHPGIVDEVVLVSCPCDINRWRKDRLDRTGFEGFIGDLDIHSPIDLIDRIPKDSGVSIIVGRDDEVTMPYLSRLLFELLDANDIDARLDIVEGDHEIFLRPDIISIAVAATKQD